MRRTGSRGPTVPKFGFNTRLDWRARIWREQPARRRRRIASEEFMTRRVMLLPVMLVTLAGCNRKSQPDGMLFVSGRIDGDTVDISSKIAGRIVDLKVREGDAVEAGQVVAWLSSPQEEAIRDTQKARIVSDQ